MNVLKDCPGVLVRKLIYTILIGAGCFIVGTAFYLFSKDVITLALSGAVFLFSFIRAAILYYTIAHKKYEELEGTCVGVSVKPLRKYSVIKIMDKNAVESTLRLGKDIRIKIGLKYRFYFSRRFNFTLGNEYFDTVLSSNQFLGFEELESNIIENEVSN